MPTPCEHHHTDHPPPPEAPVPLVLDILVLWSGLAVLTAGVGAVLGSGAKATAQRYGYRPHR